MGTINENQKASFKIIDSERRYLPFAETDYYQWLKSKGKTDVHFINTKTQYLESKDFIVGTDFLTEEDLQTLKHIEQMYFYLEVVPTLKPTPIESWQVNHTR